MALYIPHSIFHLARLLCVRPETFGPCYVLLGNHCCPQIVNLSSINPQVSLLGWDVSYGIIIMTAALWNVGLCCVIKRLTALQKNLLSPLLGYKCFAWVRNTWCVQVLRSPKEAFAAAMQSWRERSEKCVCLQGDYVEKLLHFQLPVVSSFF